MVGDPADTSAWWPSQLLANDDLSSGRLGWGSAQVFPILCVMATSDIGSIGSTSSAQPDTWATCWMPWLLGWPGFQMSVLPAGRYQPEGRKASCVHHGQCRALFCRLSPESELLGDGDRVRSPSLQCRHWPRPWCPPVDLATLATIPLSGHIPYSRPRPAVMQAPRGPPGSSRPSPVLASTFLFTFTCLAIPFSLHPAGTPPAAFEVVPGSNETPSRAWCRAWAGRSTLSQHRGRALELDMKHLAELFSYLLGRRHGEGGWRREATSGEHPGRPRQPL